MNQTQNKELITNSAVDIFSFRNFDSDSSNEVKSYKMEKNLKWSWFQDQADLKLISTEINRDTIKRNFFF